MDILIWFFWHPAGLSRASPGSSCLLRDVSVANPEPAVLRKFEVFSFREREGGPIRGQSVDADMRLVDRDDVEGIVLAAAARGGRCSGLNHQR